MDLLDRERMPSLEELHGYVKNSVLEQFCTEVKERYAVLEKMEYSKCSMAPGWNVKFRKSGKSLCTVYPHEGYITVLVVVGKKEKEAAEALLSDCDRRLREIYEETQEGNGQRWLMIDLEDEEGCFWDVFRLLEIRQQK